jgi:hypothetical protein
LHVDVAGILITRPSVPAEGRHGLAHGEALHVVASCRIVPLQVVAVRAALRLSLVALVLMLLIVPIPIVVAPLVAILAAIVPPLTAIVAPVIPPVVALVVPISLVAAAMAPVSDSARLSPRMSSALNRFRLPP